MELLKYSFDLNTLLHVLLKIKSNTHFMVKSIHSSYLPGSETRVEFINYHYCERIFRSNINLSHYAIHVKFLR